MSVMCIYPKADLDSAFNMTTKVLLARKIVGRWNSMLNSPASSRYEDTYILNTAVKPDYQEPDYAEDVKSLDVKWNVYVDSSFEKERPFKNYRNDDGSRYQKLYDSDSDKQ